MQIPGKSLNLNIVELQQSGNFIAATILRSKEDNSSLELPLINFNFKIQSSGKLEIQVDQTSVKIDYNRDIEGVSTNQSLKVIEPLPYPVNIYLLKASLDHDSTIFWNYYLQPNSDDNDNPIYKWRYVTWGTCSVTCGSGIKISKPCCFEVIARAKGVSEREVEPIFCQEYSEPNILKESCDEKICPPEWWIGPWQQCIETNHQSVSEKNYKGINFNRLQAIQAIVP